MANVRVFAFLPLLYETLCGLQLFGEGDGADPGGFALI